MNQPTRVLECFCGIGGAALAMKNIPNKPQLALDIYPLAIEVYRRNFPTHPAQIAEIESFDLRSIASDFWWLSPPCLPFTQRGHQRDWDDPRTQALKSLITRLPQALPESLVIENVPPFQSSRTASWICNQLTDLGYQWDWEVRCPTQLGWPMRRLRCYLVASRSPLRPLAEMDDISDIKAPSSRLHDFLEPNEQPELRVQPQVAEKYGSAMHVVAGNDRHAITACFTSAYGKSPIRSGSYLRQSNGSLRYFTPREIARLMGFPDSFDLSSCPTHRIAWSLLGNSVSVPVVRWILSRVFQVA